MSWQHIPLIVAAIVSVPIIVDGIATAIRVLRAPPALDLDASMIVHSVSREDLQ